MSTKTKTKAKQSKTTPAPAPVKAAEEKQRPTLAAPSARFLGIATQTTRGISHNSQVERSKKTCVPRISKQAHLGYFVRFERYTDATREAVEARLREVENIAEFDGPTCKDAALMAADMVQAGATLVEVPTFCKADITHPARVSRWKDLALDQVEPVPTRNATAKPITTEQ